MKNNDYITFKDIKDISRAIIILIILITLYGLYKEVIEPTNFSEAIPNFVRSLGFRMGRL